MNNDFYDMERQRRAEAIGESLSLQQKLLSQEQEAWNQRVDANKTAKKAKKQSYADRLRKHFSGQTA